MKILYLSPTGQPGGAEVALIELLAGLRELHPNWSLSLISASEGPLLERVRALGVDATVLPFPASLARVGDWGLGIGFRSLLSWLPKGLRALGPTWRYASRLRQEIRLRAPDVLHTNGLKMHVLGAWVRPASAALVWHMHDYIGRRRLTAQLLRRCAGRCSAVVANSQSVAKDVRRVCGSKTPVHQISNAVDLERFSPKGPVANLDHLSGLPSAATDLVRIGLVATFARWKGHSTFLKALALLPPAVVWRGYIVGGPLYDTAGSQTSFEELRAEVEALGLGDRVGFPGFVADASTAMRALDIVVHASTEPEPFGLVIAEAMACGRAVVVAEAGGAAELVTSGAIALVYPPGDAHALADRIARLALDSDLRRRLGGAGRAKAQEAFSRQRMTNECTAAYRLLVSNESRVRAAVRPA